MGYHFASSSNLSNKRLEIERLTPEDVKCKARSLGRLDGYKLVFNKPSAYFIGAGAGNIEEDVSCSIYGTLNEISEAGLLIFDKYENVTSGQYEQLNIRVLDIESDHYTDAITYIAYNNLSNNLMPRRGYMTYLHEDSDLLPAEYIKQLKPTPLTAFKCSARPQLKPVTLFN